LTVQRENFLRRLSPCQTSRLSISVREEVTLQTRGYDKDKRTLANVLLSDGTNVNHALVKESWCWWYRKYAPGDTVLEGLETEAREDRKGLWTDPQPVPP
jgi:endonuclease YncB( thermonuclease family)